MTVFSGDEAAVEGGLPVFAPPEGDAGNGAGKLAVKGRAGGRSPRPPVGTYLLAFMKSAMKSVSACTPSTGNAL